VKPYKNLQRTLTHAIESEKAEKVLEEARERGRKDVAHLNSCLGTWILGAPITHLRYTNCQYTLRNLGVATGWQTGWLRLARAVLAKFSQI
jgi:hypothetical protein